ncbi:MAG: hypothetical protein ABI412_02340 [Sphingomicrobium sp.]
MFVDMVRLWNRGIEAQRMLTETWSSAASVVSHRSDTIAKAIENPMTGDYRELTQMVGEKVEGMTESAGAVMADWGQWQRLWSAHVSSMMGAFTAANGGLIAAQRVATSGEKLTSLALSSSVRALAPIHRRATANKRRLSHKR